MLQKKRFRNVGLWIAITAFIVDVLIYTGTLPEAESETVTMLVQRFLELLVLAGILSNPTRPDGKGFNL